VVVAAVVAVLALSAVVSVHAVDSELEVDAVPQLSDFPPIPKVQVFWKGNRRIKKLSNKNFLKGHIYTLGEKIYGLRTLINNATVEMSTLANLTAWHHNALNLTRGQLEDIQSKYSDAKLRQVLLQKATTLLKLELRSLKKQFNISKTVPLRKIENQIKYDLLSISSSPRARSQLLATLALQRAMKRVTRLHRRFVRFLKYLARRDGKILALSLAPISGFNESVKRISAELKDLDSQILKLRGKASTILRRAILKRGHERAEAFAARTLRAWVKDESRRLKRAKKMLRRTREALKNFK